jgi:hypothetical protein
MSLTKTTEEIMDEVAIANGDKCTHRYQMKLYTIGSDELQLVCADCGKVLGTEPTDFETESSSWGSAVQDYSFAPPNKEFTNEQSKKESTESRQRVNDVAQEDIDRPLTQLERSLDI